MSWFYEHTCKVSLKGPAKKFFHILFYGLSFGVFLNIIWASVIWTLSFVDPAFQDYNINFYQSVILSYLIIIYDLHLHILRLLIKRE